MPTTFAPPSDTPALFLEDGDEAITALHYGEVGGTPRIYNFGTDVLFEGFIVINPTAINPGGGRVYGVTVEIGETPDMSSGVIEAWSVSLTAAEQVAIPFTNSVVGDRQTYCRVKFSISGSAASLTCGVWLMPNANIDDMSKANLAKFMGVVVAQFENASYDFRQWAGGTEDGGENNDGYYPLRDGNGTTHLIPCPARIAADAGGAMTKDGILALTRHTTVPSVGYTSPEVIGLVGGPSGELRRFPLDLFTSRHTRDLEPLATLISGELIPSYNASTGLERSIALGELMRQTMGMVNPQHYGVVPDCFSVRRGFSMTSGSDVLTCTEAVFRSGDVGKRCQIGGWAAGSAYKGTIIQYLNQYSVRLDVPATYTSAGQDGNFGTLNTVAMQNALDACFNPRGLFNYGSILMLPQGGILTGALQYRPRTGIMGHGSRQSVLVRWDDSFLSNAWSRYDGDTSYYPITQYLNGSYYIPVYPNVYKAPWYAGSYAPEIAPTLCNQIGIDIWGTDWGWDDTGWGQFSVRGQKVDSDFNVFNDFALDGSRYCSNRLLPGFEFRGGLFSPHDFGSGPVVTPPYAQVDPYLRMRDINCFLHGHVPMATFGQCSGIITGIDNEENNLTGYRHDAFDCNISNCYFMGNNGPGILAGGTNTNWTTMKISFNTGVGNSWYHGSEFRARSNLVIDGIGHNWNNMRAQESDFANVAVFGRGNDFTGCHFDDTGCVYPVHQALNDAPTIAANMNWITPAVFVGPDAEDLRLNDCGMGGLVHVGQNYASHAIFWGTSGGNLGEYTSGRMFTKSIGGWFNSGNAAITGDYAPNEWGAEGGAAPVGTSLTLNGIDITTL